MSQILPSPFSERHYKELKHFCVLFLCDFQSSWFKFCLSEPLSFLFISLILNCVLFLFKCIHQKQNLVGPPVGKKRKDFNI